MSMFWKKKAAKPMKWCELGAGWGDAITVMYTSSRYNDLELLEPGEQATVVLMSHNPHVRELFQWHPKRAQLIIRDLGFWWPKDDAERRAYHKLPPAQPFVFKLQEKCSFYPSPEDQKILGQISSGGPYVVVSVSAGGVDRNIPAAIYESAVDGILKAGLKVVVVGRSYVHHDRVEQAVKVQSNVVNLIDRLTIPGTAKLIERAAGVFCCHSAICLLSWYMKRPTFLLYPEHVREREFHSAHQYTFGKDFPTTRHMEFSKYAPASLEEFLSNAVTR